MKEEQSKKRKDGSSRAKVLNIIELPVCGSNLSLVII